MQELLVDELSGDQVILAPARALRPDTFRATAAHLPASVASCPFCAGNEHETPPEVARAGPGAPDTPGWRVRVVPNKYPIVGDGVAGVHEVVIFSPAHDADIGRLSPDAAVEAIAMLRDRTRFHLERGCTYAQPFLNHGKPAGASIEHPHAQLVALDSVPPRALARLQRLRTDAFARDQHHVVSADAATVWCPRAPVTPFLTRIAVPGGGPRFDLAADDATGAFARALHDTIARMQRVLGDLAYNVVVATAPRDHSGAFQWWADIVPRLNVMAGFEMGTGMWVNIVAPSVAADPLRDAG
jgi:UDPglucose--hexose-1-phosphate uridylyltransferase